MFPKILPLLQLFVDFKLISVLFLVFMSTLIDCQSNQSICDFIIKKGRVGMLVRYVTLYYGVITV